MEMTLNIGAFEALSQDELFAVDGGSIWKAIAMIAGAVVGALVGGIAGAAAGATLAGSLYDEMVAA